MTGTSDPDVFATFRLELEHQCELAGRAFLRLGEALSSPSTWDTEREQRMVAFESVQAFAIAAANVSKILWSPRDEQSRARLRARLEIADDSPLKSRALRNHFEHFDERVEAVVAAGGARFDLVISPRSALSDVDDAALMRVIDPKAGVVYMLGTGYDLFSVYDEIKALYVRLTEPQTPTS